jgi:hypothetical protein
MYTTKEKSMEARFARVVPATTLLLCFCLPAGAVGPARAAGYKTANFTVAAPTPELAKEIGDTAEMWRKRLAVEWLGEEMPGWSQPCPITARVAPRTGAGGATSFVFDHGEVFDWRMNIQGSRERVLDSVLPHEITHTIFASHFRKPLPRWADEGACTTVEHKSEVVKQERMLIDFLKNGRGISFSQMFAMTEYPSDVMPLYSQGHSLSQWLIESRGRKEFLAFLSDGMNDDNWPRAVERHYGFSNLGTMQDAWLEWVKAGRPHLSPDTSAITQLVNRRNGAVTTASSTTSSGAKGTPAVAIYRGQSPDEITPIAAAEPARTAIAADSGPASTKFVSASGSVYADRAARAKHERRQSPEVVPATLSAGGASIYDASRNGGALRR